MSSDSSLIGHTILVTRPAHQAKQLCLEIKKAGGKVIRCPAIEILPPRDKQQALRLLKQLSNFDLAIFVSVNAVESTLALMAPVALPKSLQLAAIGISTAASLQSQGYENIIRPQRQYSSEGLLQSEALGNVEGKKIALIRGESGREWLGKTLEENGAHVTPVATYRRKRPADSKKILRHALQNDNISIISVTSNEGLENITELAGGMCNKLRSIPLVVLSDRNRQHATKLGYLGPIEVANQATDRSIVEALVKLADSMR